MPITHFTGEPECSSGLTVLVIDIYFATEGIYDNLTCGKTHSGGLIA